MEATKGLLQAQKPLGQVGQIDIIEITPCRVTPTMIDALARCLAASEPERLEEHKRFWHEWFSDEIPGSKATVMAVLGKSGDRTRDESKGQTPDEPRDQSILSHRVAGVCRLWKTPYLNGKWFVEGLEVASEMRRQGLGTRLVLRCVDVARRLGVQKLHAHIHDSNTASRRLFEKLGFVETAHGYLSAYGEWRERGSEYTLVLDSPR